MAKQFWSRSGIEPFSISQTVTVEFRGTPSPLVLEYEERLKESSIGTLGFLTDEESGSPGIDAKVVSLYNELE